MKKLGLRGAIHRNRRLFGWGAAAALVLAWLMLYKLGSLTGGLSRSELSTAATTLGWHGIYNNPLNLPLKLARSAVFYVWPHHGQALIRLPNVFFGILAIVSYGVLVRLWYGSRIAALAAAMFATGAWTLHVSRLASSDVMYLWAFPALLLGHFMLQKYYQNAYVWFGTLITWGLLLYVPGMAWFVLASAVLQRRFVAGGWRHASRWWQRSLYVFAGLASLPLLANYLARHGDWRTWLGLPAHFEGAGVMLKHFAGVPVHLFIRGPEYPQLWLGKTLVLDVFSLAACILGIYFYISHWKSPRSRYIALLAVMGFVLVGLNGAVTLSLLVPLLYVAVATGLAYLLREWLKIFPNNPLARGLGLGLVILAVALSCTYNYRAYFVAWPHTATTRSTFQYRQHP